MKFAQAFRLLISVCSRYCFLFTRPVLCVFYIFIMLLHANAIFFSVAFAVVDITGSRCICHGYCYIALADDNALFHNTNILFAFFRSFHVFMHSVWTHLIFYASERRAPNGFSFLLSFDFYSFYFENIRFDFACRTVSRSKCKCQRTENLFFGQYRIYYCASALFFVICKVTRCNIPGKPSKQDINFQCEKE